MSLTENAVCLRNFVETGSEGDFAQLVTRHIDLVYSAALRLVGGDAHLAQDVAQAVFTDLARKARALPADVILGGWLYRHTCFTASKAVRTERRRQERERQSVEMNEPNDSSAVVWQQLAPVLEEAMGELSDPERNAIVLRFFERQPFKSVGDTLGTSEEGARKRVDRALGKLRGFFGRRGVTISAAVLADVLHTQAVTLAPAGMAAGVAAASLAGAAVGAGTTTTLLKLMLVTKSQIALTAAGVALAALLVIQTQTGSRLRDENRALLAQKSQFDALQAENTRLADRPQAKNVNASGLAPDEKSELLRLRGDVGRLKRQMASDVKTLARERTSRDQAPVDSVAAQLEAKQTMIEKLNFGRQWMLALRIFCDDNHGQFPTNFDQAITYYTREPNSTTNVTTAQFELMYQGSLNSIAKPSETIVLREKEPTLVPGQGNWIRAYGFADGHSEIHNSPDGDYDAWEKPRLQKPAGQ